MKHQARQKDAKYKLIYFFTVPMTIPEKMDQEQKFY